MARIEAAAIETARKAAEARSNADSFAALMHAYRLAGRYAEADRIGSRITVGPEAMVTLDERTAWAIDEHADVLAAMGRFDEADRRRAALAAIDIRRSPWLVGFMINRAALSVTERDWTKAPKLVSDTIALYGNYASPYARQLLRWLQICAQHGSAPKADPSGETAELIKYAKDARDATIDGLLCIGKKDEAADLLIAWLDSGQDIGDAIDRLQPAGTARGARSTAGRQAWHDLLARPAVRAAFDKAGRELPEMLWPVRISGNNQ
jgi:alkanesulfonate monooxygenase SsuD/methylene tetrahydromethanopterin reductase-like flavin-dependent oxidoreductase (luciferase family)